MVHIHVRDPDTGKESWDKKYFLEVTDRIRQISLGLLEVGIERGDRVAIVLPNGPEMAAAFVAFGVPPTVCAEGGCP